MADNQVKLSLSSLAKLKGVHPDLVRVIKKAAEITKVEFAVIEGLRTLERQKQLVAAGASKTLKSRHLTGHAADVVPLVDGRIRWDWPLYHKLAPFIKAAARAENVPIEWGGDWKSFPDGPHWQLPKKKPYI
jgi:peptidoglycan L-alanyl-D-glutamate endopeptidase CwlK